MLLKHLYDYALSRKLLDDLAFASKAVRWIINVDTEGNCIGIVETGDGKRGQEFPSCPRILGAKTGGGMAEFLVDGMTAVFGCDSDPEPKKKRTELQEKNRQKNNALKHIDFWEQIETAAAATSHPGLAALQTFCQKLAASDATVLRYGKPTNEKVDVNSTWWINIAGEEKKLGTENFTFQVNGELLIENENIRDWWRRLYDNSVEDAAIPKNGKCPLTESTCKNNCGNGRCKLATGLCLVKGDTFPSAQPLAIRHNPKITGIPNTGAGGGALVSFDKPAFASYGFGKSLNSPVSEDVAIAYCTALNDLIEKENTSLRIGQTVLCFWAAQTETAGGRFAQLLNKPKPEDVRKFLVSPWMGMKGDLAKKDTFLAVTLTGNSGRVVVRHWLQQTLGQAIENFQKWFADLEMHVPPKRQAVKKTKKTDKQTEYNPLSVYWLANTTVRETKDLPPEVLTQLYRAALENTAPSPLLIKPILAQLQSHLFRDENYNLIYDQSRFALLKLIVNRNRKETDMKIDPYLTAETGDPAYNCGRLLSVLSETQRKAQGKLKDKGFSGVAERYFGTASVSPATVFPLLLRLNRHHLDKIRKSGGNAYEEVIIRNIIAKFQPAEDGRPPVFPRYLKLQEQGRFALGFYQQQAEDANARIAFNVLAYLEEINTTAHAETLALQEDDREAFYKKVKQYYGSTAFKEWSETRKKLKITSSPTQISLFDSEQLLTSIQTIKGNQP